nr:MAG TPA: hypothetical protein [Caudoviricetes sp.]DAZ09684.1 MAG TPA: hypothetical protein [Caudoviricetes sp.]
MIMVTYQVFSISVESSCAYCFLCSQLLYFIHRALPCLSLKKGGMIHGC